MTIPPHPWASDPENAPHARIRVEVLVPDPVTGGHRKITQEEVIPHVSRALVPVRERVEDSLERITRIIMANE